MEQDQKLDPPLEGQTHPKKKQAVILIHGIGEQRPMDTLRGFVDAVWQKDLKAGDEPGAKDVWSKPDTYSKNLELRCLTTRRNANGVRTDFFEVYWAHLMQGTSAMHVIDWVRELYKREDLEPRVRYTVYLLLGLFGLIGAAGIATVYYLYKLLTGWSDFVLFDLAWLHSGVSVACAIISLLFLYGYFKYREPVKQVVGDAARYLSPLPSNIEARAQIRQAGLRLIDELHKSGKYERIVLVGHSLGSVIGYDILTYAWPRYNASHIAELEKADKPRTRQHPAIKKFDEMVSGKKFGVYTYRKMQSELLDALQSQGNRWLVTDFVTLGSPLTHASVVMAENLSRFEERKTMRELPVAPPVLEQSEKDRRASFCYRRAFTAKSGREHRAHVPHHAAVFAVTRWTNLYFPIRANGKYDLKGILKGDPIGGPIDKQPEPGKPRAASEMIDRTHISEGSLGDYRAILDVPLGSRFVWPREWRVQIFSWLGCHTKYWSLDGWDHPQGEPVHLEALRRAVNLDNEEEPFMDYLPEIMDKSGGEYVLK